MQQQEQKSNEICLFIIFCILANFFGKKLGVFWELPVWLDSFGTVLAAYMYGPFSGAVVGLSVNIISNFSQPAYMIYGITSIAMGVIVGICARKKMLEDLFGLFSTGFLVTILSVVVSTPLNCFFFDGYTGNKWGDGLINLLKEQDVHGVICYAAGEYYVDFVDRLVTFWLLYAAVHLMRNGKKEEKKILSLLLAGMVAGNFLSGTVVAQAAEYTESIADRNPVNAAHSKDAEKFIGLEDAARGGQQRELDLGTWLQTLYDDKNGLPGSVANDIAQTEDGVLWVGTYNGLYRYTGNGFQWINRYSSIKNVNCFYTDDEGRLWIGTNDSGLSICINDEIASVLDEQSGLPSDSVRCIHAGQGGIYYVGTSDCMAIVSISGGLSVEGVIPEVIYAKSLSVDEEGRAAVVTDGGNLFLLNGTKVLEKKELGEAGESYNCCTFGADGSLFVGTTGNQLIRYTVSEGILQEKSRMGTGGLTYINSINFTEGQDMVLCGNNGIATVDGRGEVHRVNVNSFNSSVDHMICDYQGNIWFTSSRYGLLKMCETPFTELYGKLGIEEKVVNSIVEWNGGFYFGTDKGLDAADRGLTEPIESSLTKELEGIRIRCLMTDREDSLWISTSTVGVWRVDKNGKVTVYDSKAGALGDRFRSTLELADGTVVLAGDLGLTYVKEGKITRTIGHEEGLDNPKTLCLLEQADGTLLAGSDGYGIAEIINGNVEGTLRKKEGLSSDVILRMVADEDGTFIVTSNSLCYMEKNGEIRVLDNFPYYNNYDLIVGKDGKIFVTGSDGVYVVDREELLNGKKDYVHLDAARGLLSSLTANSWNYVDERQNLYLANYSGVTMLNMEEYDGRHRTYRVNIKTMDLDGTPHHVHLGKTVTIPKDVSRLVIYPEIVNYTTNNPNVSYYLEGFSDTLHSCPLNELKEVVYTNLPPGKYVFHLAVLDETGKVETENTYRIEKVADIYDEEWFMAYVVFVFILTIIYLTWAIFRTQIQKTLNIQKRELELAKKQLEMGNEAIITIAKTVDAKDINTSQHSARVSEYAVMIARRIGFSEEEVEELRKTALLHDIGKIGIPDRVLNKPGKLSDEEYALMKSHVTKGAEILAEFATVPNIVEGAKYHHERYDGKGYAQGLKGEEIPLRARIIGIADAFDAMTANRVYRKKLDFDYVLGELKRGRGTQFDPHLTDVFLELIADGTVNVKNLYVDYNGERGAES